MEQVGAALYADWVEEDIGNEYVPWEMLPDKETWLRRARVMIEALRPPNSALLETIADEVGYSALAGKSNEAAASTIWTRAIGHLLCEGDPTYEGMRRAMIGKAMEG